MNPHHVDEQEAWGTEACMRAARLERLADEKAESCDGGEHGCEFCPWRDPLNQPQRGDRLTLANGRRIEVEYTNMHHTVAPRLAYRYLDIRRGRSRWDCRLADWYAKVAGASVDQIGMRPGKWVRPGIEEAAGHREHVVAFDIANRKVERIESFGSQA